MLQDAAKVSMPVSIDAEYLSYKSSVKEILIRHRTRVKQNLKQNIDLTYVPVRNRTDLLAMQARLKRRKDAHRAAVNWITREELEKFGANSELAEDVFIEIQKLLNEQSQP